MRRQFVWTGIVLALGGCATGPGGGGSTHRGPAASLAPVPQQVEHVAEAPRLAPPPASTPEISPARPASYADTWISLSRWSRQNGYGPIQRISTGADPMFALATSNGVFSVRVNSLTANWGGVELHLGFEPQLIDNQPFVHVLDLQKNVEPLIHDPVSAVRSRRVVVLDPGHGGSNTGATSIVDGDYEKEFTLDWARRLELSLTRDGWQVFLTRTNDVDVSLSDRVAIAEEHHADLFISLHFNSAAPNEEQAGLETYCLTPVGMPSTLTRGYPDDLTAAFANNAFDGENLELAAQVHRALLSVVGTDRGIRHARFLGVLRGQNRPAILIEGGFLSNPAEARRIEDPAYRQELAEAVASALARSAEGGTDNAGSGRPASALGSPIH